jgi:hypothetical protein
VQKLFSNNAPSYVVGSDVKYEVKSEETVPGKMNIECIGLEAAVKDIRIEKDGKVLYQSDFSKGMDATEESNEWKLSDGAIETTNYGFYQLGDPKWEDYTATVKLKYKKGIDMWGGAFILRTGVSEMNSIEWKIDNHGKSSHANAVDDGYGGANVNIEDGEWHEMKMEVKGPHVKCILDGKVIHDYTFWSIYKFAANAGVDSKTGEIVIKAVNGAPEPMTTTLNLAGVKSINPNARVTVLTAKKLTDENTFENPKNVVPVSKIVTVSGSSFTYEFAPNSLTVLRLKTK